MQALRQHGEPLTDLPKQILELLKDIICRNPFKLRQRIGNSAGLHYKTVKTVWTVLAVLSCMHVQTSL